MHRLLSRCNSIAPPDSLIGALLNQACRRPWGSQPSGMSRNVDELWAQLKQQASGSRRRDPGLTGLAGLPGVTSRVRTVDKGAPKEPAARPSFIGSLGSAAQGDGGGQNSGADQQALLVSAAAAACLSTARALTACCRAYRPLLRPAPPRPALCVPSRPPCSETSTA